MIKYAALFVFALFLNLSQSDLILGGESNINVGVGSTDEFDLVIRRSPAEVTNVDCKISIRGTVVLESKKEDEEDATQTTFPLKVENKYKFDERFLSERKSKLVRHYQEAESNISIGKGHRKNCLEPANGLVLIHRVAENHGTKNWTLTASGKTLEEAQYDMLAVPFNTVIVDRLCSHRNVHKGYSWQPDDQLVAEAILIDAVDVNDIEIKVLGNNNDIVELLISGHAEGVIDGANSKVSVNGTASFDTRIGRLTKFRISMNEDRSPSQAAPGYKAIIELETTISPSTHPERLSQQVIRSLGDTLADDSLLFEAKSGRFSLKHDRDWKIVSDQGNAVALRLISAGDPIAQCTVFDLPDLPADKPLKVANFKKLVTEMITDESIGIDKIQEAFTRDGKHVLRVSANGKQATADLRWNYYHIADKQGQRLLFIFTMEEKLVEEVGIADQYLVESVVFKGRNKGNDVAGANTKNIK